MRAVSLALFLIAFSGKVGAQESSSVAKSLALPGPTPTFTQAPSKPAAHKPRATWYQRKVGARKIVEVQRAGGIMKEPLPSMDSHWLAQDHQPEPKREYDKSAAFIDKIPDEDASGRAPASQSSD